MGKVDFDDKTILIADDEEYVRRHLAKKLSELGLHVLHAGTGLEVLNQAEQRPHLIVMDVKMPILDGLETTIRLKDNPGTESIPVILLSAMAQHDQVERGLANGAVEYVMKPITFDRLLRAIGKHLAG